MRPEVASLLPFTQNRLDALNRCDRAVRLTSWLRGMFQEVGKMLFAWPKSSALVFAIGLATDEAMINRGDWQYAPLWIVGYIIVDWLLPLI